MSVAEKTPAVISLELSEATSTSNMTRAILIGPDSGLVESSNRNISQVARPPSSAVILGNQDTLFAPLTLRSSLVQMANQDSVSPVTDQILFALRLSQAGNAYKLYPKLSMNLDLDDIKASLVEEAQKPDFKSKFRGNVKDLEIEAAGNVRSTSGGIKLASLLDVVCVLKQGKIMVVDKNQFEKSCHVDESSGRVSEILERVSSVKKARGI